MSNWIDAEIIPPKGCIGDTEIWCKSYIIHDEYINNKHCRRIEIYGPAFKLIIIYECLGGFYARNGIIGREIYKYKYE